MDLKEEAILGDSARDHWYYVAKARALERMLGPLRVRSVLDVGAGSGLFSRLLLETGRATSATCVDPFYDEERTEAVPGGCIRFVRSVETADQDLVLFMDVLEHVQDDAALLRQYCDPLRSGAHVLITVPAFQMLWSGHDVFLEHFRRYRLDQIRDLAARCGLEVVDGRYFYGLLFPVVVLLRLADRVRVGRGAAPRSQLAPAPGWLNRTMVGIHALEAETLFRVNALAGLSVFCLLRKP